MRALPVARRSPAPDLARGAALLLIAVANAHTFVHDRGIGVRGYPQDLAGADAVLAAVQLLLVDGRAYPLFGVLFGYGIAMLARRRTEWGQIAGEPVVALVRRRGAALFGIGSAHAILLWSGDIAAAYGLLAILLAGLLVRGSTVALVSTAVGTIAVSCLLYLPVATTSADVASGTPSTVTDSATAAATARFGEWLFGFLPINALALAGAVAIGVLLARAGWLDDPVRYRRQLARTAAAGIGAGVLGGLPLALVAAGIWAPGTAAGLLAGPVQALSGYAAGVGYAAAAGLIAARWAGRGGPGPLGAALLATGQRSLSAYLAQSIAFVALFPAWTLGLGSGLPVWAATLCGVGVWAVTVLVATASDRAGLRGPAETLLRALTYGRGARSAA
ncbi:MULTISPECIES: DUF418 domain-containing protein [Pseudonocardia]|uniref:DUF418 domain-containing protein n=1 Tax=Pseudonocardia TaxID=1847 RepID=UPI000A2870CB|nr:MULTISPECIES: DUF418 domain-containing protein [Pseudonocardia]